MAKDAKGHGSDARGGSMASARSVDPNRGRNTPATHAALNQARAEYQAAHQTGVAAISQPAESPKFGMNSYTHTINDPQGSEVGRMRLGRNNGVTLDFGEGVQHNSGMAFHDAVAMPAYRAAKGGGDSFPAEKIGGELHYMTGKDYAGHTINRTVAGGKKFGHLAGE